MNVYLITKQYDNLSVSLCQVKMKATVVYNNFTIINLIGSYGKYFTTLPLESIFVINLFHFRSMAHRYTVCARVALTITIHNIVYIIIYYTPISS